MNPFAGPAAGDPLDRSHADVVLVVDDVPDNLAVLHDALDESGYTVLVATSGEAALQRAAQAVPDIVLLDAVMPGIDGFEVARRLKASPATAHIPIIFMTGLTETEHLVAALAAGGVDYVTKPIKPKEVLARMGVHLQGARLARQTRNALDAFGYASLTVRASDGRLMWQTPLARDLLAGWFGEEMALRPSHVPQAVADWLRRHAPQAAHQVEPPRLPFEAGARRLTFRLHRQTGDDEAGGEWLIVMREESDAAVIEAMSLSFGLTAREAEVLYWVAKGKINRDIADIVGASPATVKKHLERVFAKLGVETRTAAAGMAMNRIRQVNPQFEG
ncbi:response regulator [Ramlibacter sp. MAHUQ-53]|uniref:response regulator n=1 Tax=unclassified Ramlibacter TaxID=2617605 RepID=UPI003636B42F